MLNFKNTLIVGFLLIEIIIFVAVYFYGSYGMRQLQLAKKEQELFMQEVNELKKTVEKLEKQLSEWESDDFYKEKIARERLHLSKSNEHVYHLA